MKIIYKHFNLERDDYYLIKPTINVKRISNIHLLFDNISKFNENKLISGIKFITFLKTRYGISDSICKTICTKSGLNSNIKLDYIFDSYVTKKLRLYFSYNKYTLDLNIIKFVRKCIKNIVMKKTIKGMKHLYRYPVRGQRRRTNARTVKKILRF